MAHLGSTSLRRLATCDDQLQLVIEGAERTYPDDFTVVCGERDREAQERAFREGNSLVHWGQSLHNKSPSQAVDLAPYRDGRIRWGDAAAFDRIATHILGAASRLGVRLRWGGHFRATATQPYGWDPGHFELL